MDVLRVRGEPGFPHGPDPKRSFGRFTLHQSGQTAGLVTPGPPRFRTCLSGNGRRPPPSISLPRNALNRGRKPGGVIEQTDPALLHVTTDSDHQQRHDRNCHPLRPVPLPIRASRRFNRSSLDCDMAIWRMATAELAEMSAPMRRRRKRAAVCCTRRSPVAHLWLVSA